MEEDIDKYFVYWICYIWETNIDYEGVIGITSNMDIHRKALTKGMHEAERAATVVTSVFEGSKSECLQVATNFRPHCKYEKIWDIA